MTPGIGPAGRIGRFFIDSKLTPLLVLAALAVGAFAVTLTPREEEPQIVVPMVDIFLGLPGATPEEVENRLTIPLEKRMWEIPGVEYVYSSSWPGRAMVTVRFYVGEDMEHSLVKLYDKLAGGMDRAPQDATAPLVKLRTIDDVPVLAVTLWSHDYDSFALRRIAAELGRELARIDRVSDIRIIGGQRRQVRVLLDAGRLAAVGLDPAQIAKELQGRNATAPAGEFEEGDREVRVETGAFLTSAEDVASLVVGVHDGRPLHLRSVAEIADGPEEIEDYVFFAPGPGAREKGIAVDPSRDEITNAVTVTLAKRKGADALRVVEEAMEKIHALEGRLLPPGVHVTVTRDYGETSAEKARELLTHLLGAILSVTVVIAIFLGWRGGLVVFVAVPVTFALTLFVYYVFDYTLNRVTLFALIFVTGIVVDDSIIVVENIVRHFGMRRLPPQQAAIAAVNEVGNPTILATLTVIAAVLPMAFVRGLMGPYMRPMPVGASMAMQIIIDMPEGTTLERTALVAREIGTYLGSVAEVTDLQIYAGTAAPFNFNGLVRHYDLRRGSNMADVQVNLRHKDRRKDQSHDIAKRIRPPIQQIAARHGAAVKVVEIPPGPPVLSTLVSEVYGPTQETRLDLARQILDIYRNASGVVDVDWYVEDPRPKIVFEVDREKAALNSVPAAHVARTVRLVLEGEDAGVLHDEREAEPVSIRMQIPRAERSFVADLIGVRAASLSGRLVPLSELVRVKETVEPVSRHRKNLKPVVYATGDVAGTEESPIYAILRMSDEIDKLTRPHGAQVEQFYRDEPWSEELPATKWDGEWHITYEVFRDLGSAFGVALILIYILIIGWFKSFKVPLVMMIAIPLSLVGILPGHWAFGAFFTATSMIGFIALAGIMVRNSVLLIDFIDLALERGRTLGEAVVEAGAVRFRPILLTAGTVVVGAFVILFDPIFQGLAIALMTGAVASTVLTLVVVPLVHYMVERRRHEEPLPADWVSMYSKKR